MYVCLLLKDAKGQERDHRDNRSNDPSSGYSKLVHQVKDKNILVTLVVVPSTSLSDQMDNMHHEDVCFDTEFPLSRSTPGIQQAMLSLREVPK